jgi:hypothetical protein
MDYFRDVKQSLVSFVIRTECEEGIYTRRKNDHDLHFDLYPPGPLDQKECVKPRHHAGHLGTWLAQFIS